MYKSQNLVRQKNNFSMFLAIAILAVCSLPALYIKFNGMRLLLVLFILWVWLSKRIVYNAFVYSLKRRKSIVVPYFCIIALIFSHFILDTGPSGYQMLLLTLEVFIYFTIFLTYSYTDDIKTAVFFLMLFKLLMISVATPIMIAEPAITRHMDMLETRTWYDRNYLKSLGLGGYAVFASYAMNISLILYWFYNSKGNKKFLYVAALVISLIGLAISTLAGSLALAFIVLILYYSIASVVEKKDIFFRFLSLVAIIIAIAIVYITVAELETFTGAFEKIITLIQQKWETGLTGHDVSGRGNFMRVSFETFNRYPITGVGLYFAENTVVGEHNAWVDILARFGLLGGFFYFSYVSACYYWAVRSIRQADDKYWAITIFVILCVLTISGLLNPIFFFQEIEMYWTLMVAYLAGSGFYSKKRSCPPRKRLIRK